MKKIKLLLLTTLALSPIIASCGNNSGLTQNKMIIEGETTMKVGATQTLVSSIVGKLEWSSSNPFVAKINGEGLVEALSVGKTVITCKDAESNISGTLDIEVVKGFDAINNTSDLSKFLFFQSRQFEKQIPVTKLDRVVTTDVENRFHGKMSTVSTLYKDNALKKVENEDYFNHTGHVVQTNTSLYQIIGDKYYNLFLNDKNQKITGSNSKFQVVDKEVGEYGQIPLSKATSICGSHSLIADFSSKFLDHFDKATKLNFVTTDNKDNTSKVKVDGYFLFKWLGDTTKADYEVYDLELNFTTEGKLVSGKYISTIYTEDSYDTKNDVLKPTATIREKDEITYTIEDGEKPDNSTIGYDVNEYFVTKIKDANYKNGATLAVGDSIKINSIAVTNYEPVKALDSGKIRIVEVIDGIGETGAKFHINARGEWEALTAGNATLVICMEYNPNITFNIPLKVGA